MRRETFGQATESLARVSAAHLEPNGIDKQRDEFTVHYSATCVHTAACYQTPEICAIYACLSTPPTSLSAAVTIASLTEATVQQWMAVRVSANARDFAHVNCVRSLLYKQGMN